MDTATEVKNQQILLASIRNEIIEASTALSKIYEEKKKVESEVLEASEELLDIKAVSKGVLAEISQAQIGLKNREIDANANVERAKKEVEVLKKQKKEAMSELKRVNEWIFNGQEALKSLRSELDTLSQEKVQKEEYIADTEDFKLKRDIAEGEYREILVNAKLASDELEAKQYSFEDKEKKTEEKLSTLQSEIGKAEIELQDLLNNKTRIEKDLQIYINRVEKAYKEQFPDKKFKV